MNELELKKHLVSVYHGFSDSRIKKLTTGKTFTIDDRCPRDFDSRGNAFTSLCEMTAQVQDAATVEVELRRNVPVSDGIKQWAAEAGAKLTTGNTPLLQFTVTPERLNLLKELADEVKAIVKRGAPEYPVPSWKYACPRTAGSLCRLQKALRHCWGAKRSAAD
jgi:hypothetical protein